MLLPQQVVSYLHHPDDEVRALATSYLHTYFGPALPGLADEVWKALDQFGHVPRPYGGVQGDLHWMLLQKIPSTDASLTRAIEAARASDRSRRDDAEVIIRNVPFELFDRRRDEILAVLDPEHRAYLEYRLALRSMTADALWEQLLIGTKLIAEEKVDEDGNPAENETFYAKPIVEALSAYPEQTGPWAMDVLVAESDSTAWLRRTAVKILGRLGYVPAIPRLLELLSSATDDDLLENELVDALAGMPPEQVVPGLAELLGSPEAEQRLRAAKALEKIKYPSSEAAMLGALNLETDPQQLAHLAGGLGELCATEGLELLVRLEVERRYDPTIVDLKTTLVALAEMVGFQRPELALWKQEIAHPEYHEKRQLAFARSLGIPDDLYRKFLDLMNSKTAVPDARRPAVVDEPSALEPEDDGLQPIRRQSPKVGRNDPCPCGSGKKYKKCCGNN